MDLLITDVKFLTSLQHFLLAASLMEFFDQNLISNTNVRELRMLNFRVQFTEFCPSAN